MADIVGTDLGLTGLVVWIVVVAAILGIGMGAMVIAYVRPLGRQILFPQPMTTVSVPITSAAATYFQTGCEVYARQRFRQAMDWFSQVIELESTCAEALHNRGLAAANLKEDQLAVRDLLQASQLYDRQLNKSGVDQVKQHLEQIAAR